jgi:hypothetical protein
MPWVVHGIFSASVILSEHTICTMYVYRARKMCGLPGLPANINLGLGVDAADRREIACTDLLGCCRSLRIGEERTRFRFCPTRAEATCVGMPWFASEILRIYIRTYTSTGSVMAKQQQTAEPPPIISSPLSPIVVSSRLLPVSRVYSTANCRHTNTRGRVVVVAVVVRTRGRESTEATSMQLQGTDGVIVHLPRVIARP